MQKWQFRSRIEQFAEDHVVLGAKPGPKPTIYGPILYVLDATYHRYGTDASSQGHVFVICVDGCQGRTSAGWTFLSL